MLQYADNWSIKNDCPYYTVYINTVITVYGSITIQAPYDHTHKFTVLVYCYVT